MALLSLEETQRVEGNCPKSHSLMCNRVTQSNPGLDESPKPGSLSMFFLGSLIVHKLLCERGGSVGWHLCKSKARGPSGDMPSAVTVTDPAFPRPNPGLVSPPFTLYSGACSSLKKRVQILSIAFSKACDALEWAGWWCRVLGRNSPCGSRASHNPAFSGRHFVLLLVTTFSLFTLVT